MSRNKTVKPTCEYCGRLSSNYRLHNCESFPELQICWACKQWEQKNENQSLENRKKRKDTANHSRAKKKRKIQVSPDNESESEDDAPLTFGKQLNTTTITSATTTSTTHVGKKRPLHLHDKLITNNVIPPNVTTKNTKTPTKTDFTKHADKTTIPKKITQISTISNQKTEKKSKELFKAIVSFQNIASEYKDLENENYELRYKYKKYKEAVKKKKNENEILTRQIMFFEKKKISNETKIENLEEENIKAKQEIEHLKDRTKSFEALKKDSQTIYDSVVNNMIHGTTNCQHCHTKDIEIFEWETKSIDNKKKYEKILSEKKNLDKEIVNLKLEDHRKETEMKSLKHELEKKNVAIQKIKQREYDQKMELRQYRIGLDHAARERERFGRLQSTMEPRTPPLNYRPIGWTTQQHEFHGRNVHPEQRNQRDPYRPPRPNYGD